MGLRKGMTNNPRGKPVGALNRLTRDMKTTIHEFLQDSWPEVVKEFHTLRGRDKLDFFKDLLQYDLPKMRAMEVSGEINFATMTEQDLDTIAEKLYNNYGKDKN